MAMQYDSNFEEGNVLPSKVLNNIIDSIKENEESISLNFGKKITKRNEVQICPIRIGNLNLKNI